MIELLSALAVWRLSSLLVNESGPFEVFSKIRFAVGVRYDAYAHCTASRGVAGAFCCIFCMSLWVSAAAALALMLWRSADAFTTVIDWLAFSTGAILVETVVHRD